MDWSRTATAMAITLCVTFSSVPSFGTEEKPESSTGKTSSTTADDLKELQKKAKAGEAEAQFNLGGMYFLGKGISKNYTEAAKWYRKSAEHGYSEAQYNLGWMYANGQGVPKDYTKAMKWYRKAAEQGLTQAQYNLAVMYGEGKGVPLDYVEAVKWYRKAAKQGIVEAQYNLAVMYYKGEGVPKNYTEAVKWSLKAAEQGYSEAQYNLGVLYANGEGVKQDWTEATKWYRKAAEQGHRLAPLELASVIKRKSSVNPLVVYEIIDTQDQSHKALVKSLSEYKSHELAALPWDKKMLYRIVVSPKIKENQVRPTIEKIISDITTRDNDIDEISLFLFSDKEVAKGGMGYDVASATWAPGGKLGNITPDIAKNNIRTGYKISIKAEKNLEAYLEQRGLSEEKFGFTEKQRRQIFIELVVAEDRAEAEAEKIYPLYPLDPNYKESNVSKHFDKSDEVGEKYKAQVRSKYGITKEIQLKISVEGLQESWPMP